MVIVVFKFNDIIYFSFGIKSTLVLNFPTKKSELNKLQLVSSLKCKNIIFLNSHKIVPSPNSACSITHSLSEQNAFNEKLGIDKQAPARQTVECSHLKVNSFYDSHEAVVTAVIFTISQNIQCRIIKTNITVIHNAIKE